MPKKINVQDTHISEQLRALHGALLTVVSVMNRPQRDEAMVREAASRSTAPCFRCWWASNA